jgi:transposase
LQVVRLPKRFGRWNTIYMRMNRWAKKGLLDRVFEQLQVEQIVRIRIEAFSIDSTSVKVHPDGTGALKKRTAGHRIDQAADSFVRRIE